MRASQRLKWVLLTTPLLLALVLVVRRSSQLSEPAYQGRTLTQWVQDYSKEPTRDEARKGATQIVIKDHPVLLKMLAYDPSRHRTKEWLSQTLPTFIVESRIGDFLFRHDEKARQAELALAAFWLAGTNTAVALPELASMALSTNGNPQRAVQALACVGPEAGRTLELVITNAASTLARREAVEVYQFVEPRREEYVRVLSEAFNDAAWGVRECATNYLKRFPSAGASNRFQPRSSRVF